MEFSFAVADNEILLDNFLNRGLTWAEAAWSAIPVLSWQHVVLGDPRCYRRQEAALRVR